MHLLPSSPVCRGVGGRGPCKRRPFSSGTCHLPAHFSPDGAQLLTTDQKSEIRVYSASQWDSPPSLIPHPHRHFQHLTPIKVSDGVKHCDHGDRSGLPKVGSGGGQITEAFPPRSLPALTQSSLSSPGSLCSVCPTSAIPLCWVFFCLSDKLFS